MSGMKSGTVDRHGLWRISCLRMSHRPASFGFRRLYLYCIRLCFHEGIVVSDKGQGFGRLLGLASGGSAGLLGETVLCQKDSVVGTLALNTAVAGKRLRLGLLDLARCEEVSLVVDAQLASTERKGGRVTGGSCGQKGASWGRKEVALGIDTEASDSVAVATTSQNA